MTPANIKDWRGVPASKIADGLWQSGLPYFKGLVENGVTLVVLAASAAQPSESDIAVIKKNQRGLGLLMCPLDDTENPDKLGPIVKAAGGVAERLAQRMKDGHVVLVTCEAGRNRSGLICALTLRARFGWSGKVAADMVRSARLPALPNGEEALSNRTFYAYLESLPALAVQP